MLTILKLNDLRYIKKLHSNNGTSPLFGFNNFLSTLGNTRSKVLKILSTPFLATQHSGDSHRSVIAIAKAAASFLGFSTRLSNLFLLGFSFLSSKAGGIGKSNVEILSSTIACKWREQFLPTLYFLRTHKLRSQRRQISETSHDTSNRFPSPAGGGCAAWARHAESPATGSDRNSFTNGHSL
jgi:hypothetical protein